jgi:DNA-binding MarR family transcriptional regulator
VDPGRRREPKVTTTSACAAAPASPGPTNGSSRLTAIGRPVSRRAAATSSAIGARTPPIVPSPPASDTAAASSCHATPPMPAWTMGTETAQIQGRHRGERLRGQLLLHGGEIEPGALAADPAVFEVEDVQEAQRATNITPQAMNGVLVTLEREGLVERRAHATHGRILQTSLSPEGRSRLDAATPAVRAVERSIERDLSVDQVGALKGWLVATAERLRREA